MLPSGAIFASVCPPGKSGQQHFTQKQHPVFRIRSQWLLIAVKPDKSCPEKIVFGNDTGADRYRDRPFLPATIAAEIHPAKFRSPKGF